MQKVFSHSSLNCFENCPKQYFFRYIEKRPVESESIEAFLGKRVHEILERLHLFVADGRVPSLERVVARFLETWEEQFDPARIRIVRRDMSVELYRDAGVRGLGNYYRRDYPFDTGETLALERKIQFSLDPEGAYPVRGVIDKLVRSPDGALEIHDYKTGRRVPSQAVLDRDRQLALYELGVREALGEKGEVRLVWDYVLQNQVRISTRTPEQLDALREKTRGVIDRVRVETRWETKTGPLCDWCEYRKGCPAFASDPPRPARKKPSEPEASADPPPVAEDDGQWRLL